MPRRRRRKLSWPARLALAILAIPLLYVAAALIGALIAVNSGWREPDRGITIYLANNGVHADLVLPASAEGLDWHPFVPKSDMILFQNSLPLGSGRDVGSRAGWRNYRQNSNRRSGISHIAVVSV